jgi:DNA-binding transcriptional LysR family regulator
VRRSSQGGWDVQASWLAAEHIAPTPTHPGCARRDRRATSTRWACSRNITARCPHFGLIPSMVASTLLVLTTGRQYCERYVDKLPVRILPCPVEFPRLLYYQLWHERTHTSSAGRWLREQVKSVAAFSFEKSSKQ